MAAVFFPHFHFHLPCILSNHMTVRSTSFAPLRRLDWLSLQNWLLKMTTHQSCLQIVLLPFCNCKGWHYNPLNFSALCNNHKRITKCIVCVSFYVRAKRKCPLANEPQNSSVFVTTCVEDLIQNTFQMPTNLILCIACKHCFVGRPVVFKIRCVCLPVYIFYSSIQRDRQRVGGGGVGGTEAVQRSAGFHQRHSHLW